MKIKFLSIITLLSFTLALKSQTVTTYAGTGTSGSFDSGLLSSTFTYPYGMCFNTSGQLFIAAGNNNKVRKISGGSVTTFAGTGGWGDATGPGAFAVFKTLFSICSDPAGNLYVSDTYNSKIKKITPSGVVSVFAGPLIGSTDAFNLPRGICIDGAGNLYVADTDASVIRKITPTGVVSTFAGSGTYSSVDGTGTSASFNRPYGICLDPSGNLYVAERSGNKIRKITPTGVVTTLAGSGVAGSIDGIGVSASFITPQDLCSDLAGNIYVADTGNNKIRKITPSGVVSTFAGSGISGSSDGVGLAASFWEPAGICFDGISNLYIGDSRNHKIRKITLCTAPNSPTNTTTAPTQICASSTTTLTASSTGTVSWFASSTGGSSIFTGTTIVTSPTLSAGTYTYYAQANTCATSATRTPITFTVNPLPSITVNNGSICSGASFTISPTGAATYTYSGGSSIVTPTANTTYTVIGSSAEGCTNTAVSNVTVNPIVVPSILISIPNATLCGSSAAFTSTIANGGASPTYQWKKNSSSVGSGLTSYSPTSLVNGDVISCILTSNASCATPSTITSNSITITVGATPTISLSNGSVCIGSSYTLSPTGASSYTYSGGSAIVAPTANTTYTVIGSSSLGCTNTAVASVSVNPLPVVSISSSNSLICVGQTVNLTASGALTYLWNTTSTNTVLAVSPSSTTIYTVTGTDVNGCKNNASITQSVSLCTGIENLSSESLVSIYPNPTNGIITISGVYENVRIEIYNSIGELVSSIQTLNEEITFDFSNFSNGIYIFKLMNPKIQQIHKIIKQ